MQTKAKAHQLGVVSALSSFAPPHVPAQAAEVAARHGISPEAVVAFFAEFRTVERDSIGELMVEGITAEQASLYHDNDGGPFMPLDDSRRPGDGEEERWARIVAA